MPTLRIIAEDVSRLATIVASSTAPGLSIASLLTDEPQEVHRSVGTSVTYDFSFAQPVRIGGVHRPWCNSSPTSMMRVRGFSDAGGVNPLFNTGWVPECPAPAKTLRNWTPEQAASAYEFGGGAHGFAWFENIDVQFLRVEVSDPDNLQGHLECGRIILGEWWSPKETADNGASRTPGSLSKQYRNGAGTLKTDIGTKYVRQSIALSHFDEEDRAAFLDIVRANDIDVPFIFDLSPGDPDHVYQRDHMGYYKFIVPPTLSTPGFERFATTIEMETV